MLELHYDCETVRSDGALGKLILGSRCTLRVAFGGEIMKNFGNARWLASAVAHDGVFTVPSRDIPHLTLDLRNIESYLAKESCRGDSWARTAELLAQRAFRAYHAATECIHAWRELTASDYRYLWWPMLSTRAVVHRLAAPFAASARTPPPSPLRFHDGTRTQREPSWPPFPHACGAGAAPCAATLRAKEPVVRREREIP